MSFQRLFSTAFVLLAFSLSGSECLPFYAGPEIYHIKRWRNGGTKQTGRMDGVRVGFDRIKRHGWYIGVDGFYSTGHLEGHNARGRTLDSDLTDIIFEGRVGFTLQDQTECQHTFTPFVGYGYFHEVNNFHSPSPIPYTFTDTFDYFTTGFLSGFNFTPLLSMGLNFKVKFMMSGRSKISDDPLYDDVKLRMNNEIQLRVDVPLVFHCLPWKRVQAALVPFYEYRHLGGREGFPFDYIDTKFTLLGARLDLIYRF